MVQMSRKEASRVTYQAERPLDLHSKIRMYKKTDGSEGKREPWETILKARGDNTTLIIINLV